MNAIEKLEAEMDKSKDNSYVQVVGDFLLRYLETNPNAAEKILNETKTIVKSLDEMRKEAQKKKVGNCAVLTDQEGFDVILKYFGIKNKPLMPATAAVNTSMPAAPAGVDFDIKLEDLL